MATNEETIARQQKRLYGADAEILRLRRELRAAEQRGDDADARAAGLARERDDAARGAAAANSAAAEEAATRRVAWDMGKQHALSLMMESVAARGGDAAGAHAAAMGGGFLGGGFALAAATGGTAPGPSALRSGRTGTGSSRGSKYSGHRSVPGQPGMT